MLKDKVLKQLAANRGSAVSGQALAESCGVSRNAIWKAVKALEQEGVVIQACTNKGYCLNENALTRFDVELPENARLFLYDSVDSTNTQAKRLLAQGLTEDAFIVADAQSCGRGRCGKSFYSPKNTGLYLSYVFHPDKRLADAVFITTAAAVCVVRALESISTLKPTIKWVNDIYLGDKKICGILTEALSDFESGRLESVIVGIGINVNTKQFPAEIEDRAGSLNAADITRPKLLQALAQQLLAVSRDLDNPGILEEYRARSMVLGKEITFVRNGKEMRGTALEIDEKGALKVRTDSGIQTLDSGEISIIV